MDGAQGLRACLVHGAAAAADAAPTALSRRPLHLRPHAPRPAVNADALEQCTRAWFGWANALLVTLVEAGMGVDCSAAMERVRHAAILVRAARGGGLAPVGGGCLAGPDGWASLRE